MADQVKVTVCEGERVLHEGHILEAGEEFSIDVPAAEGLVESGSCELSDSKEPSAKDIVAGLSDLSDDELQDVLDSENERDKPRSTVIGGVEAEQAARAE